MFILINTHTHTHLCVVAYNEKLLYMPVSLVYDQQLVSLAPLAESHFVDNPNPNHDHRSLQKESFLCTTFPTSTTSRYCC